MLALVRDQRQKRLGPRSLGFLARRPSRRGPNLALVGHFLIIEKLEDHDISAPIFGMARVVSSSCREQRRHGWGPHRPSPAPKTKTRPEDGP